VAPFVLLALAAGSATVVTLAILRRRAGRSFTDAWGTAGIDVLLVISAGVIAVLTIPRSRQPRSVDLVPFSQIVAVIQQRSVNSTVMVAVGNVLMFVPLGALIPLRFPRFDRWPRLVALCAAISVAIEVMQFVIGHHSSAMDDVLLNMLGGAVGYVVMWVTRTAIARRSRPEPSGAESRTGA
jgi:glycopeptide antibiotics resistance protein